MKSIEGTVLRFIIKKVCKIDSYEIIYEMEGRRVI